MKALIAGAVAAIFSLFLNKSCLYQLGTAAVIFLVPLIEETAKTMSAVFMDTSIFFTHFAFGLIEAVYEILSFSRTGWMAGIAGVTGHLLFGYVTLFCWQLSQSLGVGILVASITHMAWNGLVVLLAKGGKHS